MYTSILNMHLSQDLAEHIREDEEARREAARSERRRQFSDVCKAIAGIMFDDEYQSWVDAMPERGLFDYAAAKLIELLAVPIEADGCGNSPYVVGGEIMYSPSFVSANDTDVIPF